MLSRLAAAATIFLSAASSGFGADITVGFVTSLSGPGASIGIPYEKGILAAYAYASSIGEHKIKLIRLDDASDPSAATRNARKLVQEEKADVLMGTSGVPGTVAMAVVAAETKTPIVSLTPASQPPGGDGQWLISIPQPPPLMVAAVVERMKKDNVKKVGYIGFSDSWGDLVYDALMKNVGGTAIDVLTNERYARADTSVTAQTHAMPRIEARWAKLDPPPTRRIPVMIGGKGEQKTLKIVATRPDAVITGGSGTPGALPYLALAERGYKGGLYGTHALINPDFVRVGGQSVDGVIAPTGPVIVAEQLPDDYPTKKIALQFRSVYQQTNNAATSDGFSAYSFDAWLVFLDAAKRALQKAEPGTPQFRQELRDALLSVREVVGTHAIYNFKPGDFFGVDQRSRVLVQLRKGGWKLMP